MRCVVTLRSAVMAVLYCVVLCSDSAVFYSVLFCNVVLCNDNVSTSAVQCSAMLLGTK